MYLMKSLLEGLRILAFDKETIKITSKERSLEEIFLSTLFLNYLIILIVYLIGISIGSYSINGREINMEVFFGLLMIYPFVYNLVIYGIYSFFGFVAELLNKKNSIKPLLSVGFHTAIVYTIILYIIGLFSTFNLNLGIFLLSFFGLYFIYTMFLIISTIYEFSMEQSLIIVFLPILLISFLFLLIFLIFPNFTDVISKFIFK